MPKGPLAGLSPLASQPTTRFSHSVFFARFRIDLFQFLRIVCKAARDGAQFIIATHSPILLAYPSARIFSFDAIPIAKVAYGDLEHVKVTRDFSNDPAKYLVDP